MKPKHIALIPDGNRRFEGKLKGHEFGLKKAREILKWSCEQDIKDITFFALSYENYKKRDKEEIDHILGLLENELIDIINGNHIVNEKNIRTKFIGRIGELPERIRNKIYLSEKKTKNNQKYFLRIAVNYGGKQELVDAIEEYRKDLLIGNIKPREMNTNRFKTYLYDGLTPEPDLLIRTGGRKRISNFFLYQSAYTELFFLDKLFPALTKKDFENILKEFKKRKRNFGS